MGTEIEGNYAYRFACTALREVTVSRRFFGRIPKATGSFCFSPFFDIESFDSVFCSTSLFRSFSATDFLSSLLKTFPEKKTRVDWRLGKFFPYSIAPFPLQSSLYSDRVKN